MKTVLADASSIILLFKSGLYEKWLDHYRVVMVRAVYEEVAVKGYEGADVFVRSLSKGRISVIDKTFPDLMPLPVMDLGERQTLLAFLNGHGDFIIIDDGKGAAYCRNHDLPYINALLVPRIFCDVGLIDKFEFRKTTETLIHLGRYAHWVIEYGQTASATLFSCFYP